MGIPDGLTLADTPLHEAVHFGDLEDVRECLKQGFDPNQLGVYQWSPLHEACNSGDLDIVRILLEHQGDPNRRDGLRGCSSLHYAGRQGHVTVLRLLLDAGGDVTQRDAEGCTPLEGAADGCRALLAEQCTKSIPDDRGGGVKAMESDLEQTSPRDRDSGVDSAMDTALDADEVSVTSGSSGTSPRLSGSWTGIEHGERGKDTGSVLGYVELSFEYNAKKSSLKIRVWRVYDLLLPPTDSSTISAIYVKTYLLPDNRKATKRRTEEVRPDAAGLESRDIRSGSVILKPSTFRFSRALEYSDLSRSEIAERQVHLELCLRQRYSRRSFSVGRWNMPLARATRLLVRTAFPLETCSSAGLPSSMTVYPGRGLGLSPANSIRSLGPAPSAKHTWAVPYYGIRTRSESDLDLVTVESSGGVGLPSIEVTVPEEEEDLDLQMALREIAVIQEAERSGGVAMSRSTSRSTSIEIDSIASDLDKMETSFSGSPLRGADRGGEVTLPRQSELVEVQIHAATSLELTSETPHSGPIAGVHGGSDVTSTRPRSTTSRRLPNMRDKPCVKDRSNPAPKILHTPDQRRPMTKAEYGLKAHTEAVASCETIDENARDFNLNTSPSLKNVVPHPTGLEPQRTEPSRGRRPVALETQPLVHVTPGSNPKRSAEHNNNTTESAGCFSESQF